MAGVTVRPHPTANKVIDTEVDIIQAAFAPLTLGVPGSFGLQDDAAFVPSPQTGLIVTQDQVIEGTHFLTSDPIDMVARRLVRRNLSDLIAKGGVPHAAFLSLAWPKSRPLSEILIFAEGLGDDLSQLCSHCPLLGGDTSVIEGPMVASLTMMGKPTTPSGQPVLRSGAQIGDILCVSGTIGDAWLGLQVRLGAIPVAGLEACVRVAMAPAPPKHELARLVGAYATASVDVSDGLLRDAGHIASMSGVRLELDLAMVPLSAEVAAWGAAGTDQTERLLSLVTGGDDYQTLTTVAPTHVAAYLEQAAHFGVKITPIGAVTKGAEIVLYHQGRAIALPHAKGWHI